MYQIMPGEDNELAQMMRVYLEEEGIKVHTGVTVNSIIDSGKELSVSLTSDNQQMTVAGACVLLAAGREPDVNGLSLARMGIAVENGAIQVTDTMETSLPGVCAAGDVIGGWMLAHTAMAEAKCAVRTLMGAGTPINRNVIPRCVYGMPELAAVGLTEEQAADEYRKVKVGRFPFKFNSRALAMGQASGLVKIITDTSHGEILGVHILGPAASELIAEATLAMQLEATYEDLAYVIHAHPTLSEANMEAALGVEGLSIHY
jgi:dihydrolipoamide dehydrogenase